MAINKKWLQVTEDDILEANITKYNNDNVIKYYSENADAKYTYAEYDVVLTAVIDALTNNLGRSLKAVDMCGGAGKAAFIMKQYSPASDVYLVDLSEKMLDIAQKRMIKEGIGSINIVHADAYSFLDQDAEYDLIVFSSAIHHFKDPIKLLETAAQRLSPQGIIITMAEPTKLVTSRRFKFLTFVFAHKEYQVAVMRKWAKSIISLGKAEDDLADIAEYQAYQGIDDTALARQLNTCAGLCPLVHMRYPAGEPFMLKIMPYIGLSWTFGMVLRKGQHPDDKKLSVELQERIKLGLPFKIHFL